MRACPTLAVMWIALAAWNPAVGAGLFGHKITADWIFPNPGDVLETHAVTVGPDVELPGSVIISDSDFSIDLRDNLIVFATSHDGHWQDTSANGWRFTDADSDVPDIIGFEIAFASDSVTGLDPEDLSFDANSVFANFGDSGPTGEPVTWKFGDRIALRIQFVPEPTSGCLLLLGLALSFRARRRLVCAPST